jgi:hypothetical protein
MPDLYFLLVVHAALGLLVSLITFKYLGWIYTQGVAAGVLLSLVNMGLLVFAWSRIFEKKQVALSIGVIVFKFAILGWIIYKVVSRQLFPLEGFAAGMGLVMISAVLTALRFAHINREKVVD